MSAPPAPLAQAALTAAAGYARDAHAEATRRAYRADWADFVAWCHAAALPALPAGTIYAGSSIPVAMA